jgi:hypothetical protein
MFSTHLFFMSSEDSPWKVTFAANISARSDLFLEREARSLGRFLAVSTYLENHATRRIAKEPKWLKVGSSTKPVLSGQF